MRKSAAQPAYPDLSALSVEQLTALIAEASALREERLAEARADLRAEIAAKAEALGLSVDELMGADGQVRRRRGRPPGKRNAVAGKRVATKRTLGKRATAKPGKSPPGVVRFRGPDGEAWTGRGPTPRWLKALEEKGQKREKFAV